MALSKNKQLNISAIKTSSALKFPEGSLNVNVIAYVYAMDTHSNRMVGMRSVINNFIICWPFMVEAKAG